MADLEKQLRSVKQERNALAATLRQHGFLGKQNRSNNAFGASGHEEQQYKAQTDLCRQSAQMRCATDGDLASSGDIQPSGSNSNHQPAQQARSENIRAAPSPASSETHASYNSHSHEASCLRDTTNVMATTSASPAVKSSHPAAQVHQRSGFEAGSPMYADQQASQAHATQARLHELEQLAQELLL